MVVYGEFKMSFVGFDPGIVFNQIVYVGSRAFSLLQLFFVFWYGLLKALRIILHLLHNIYLFDKVEVSVGQMKDRNRRILKIQSGFEQDEILAVLWYRL